MKQIVTLNCNVKTLANDFKAGQTFRVLGTQGTLVRLSRTGDCAKLTTLPEYVGLGVYSGVASTTRLEQPPTDRYSAPHQDASGPSRVVVIATCLAGKDSGTLVMHFTPAEEREYNAGMARMAELYPD
jgi:hypothetical protein